ncbi:DNA phosphorothioation-dependent restriction protein DptF [Marinomonas balearica]|uniref:DNA phosphorothioation-dependent restriction protein DptF n=1 Tax=Marinomonas balearica TaxID=491947 RepID=A0A4R6M5X9_9GAMM|nr:DNA phosphorothioation-dependent restriction protein DptF [Marinomonas balearica]TDO96723.1 DNA phosphorothioation-dependent restriction protein DptF [Marinomonas balearica]
MEFYELLSSLSRSSASAVITLSKAPSNIERFKDYLHIETEIEQKFRDALEEGKERRGIVFLCGSSGDGKSELLRRYYDQYSKVYQFHLDATHSFKPDQNAVEALNELFDSHAVSDKPLVIGINIGMMFNYLNSGAGRHNLVKDAIKKFINGERKVNHLSFVSFEDYPKFSLAAGEVGSSFISQLLERVTSSTAENPLYQAYVNDSKKHSKIEYQNYRVLQERTVQELIVKLLLQARLKYDQFFSSRSLLDFIYHLIAGGQSIFDNLFNAYSGGLVGSLSSFDPCLIRSKRIDEFVVQQSLSVKEEAFESFKASLVGQYQIEIDKYTPSTWIRAFFLLRKVDIGNGYHRLFESDFEQPLFDEYVRIWQMHHAEKPDLKMLRKFYKDSLIESLRKFANRLVSKVVKDGIYIAERNGVVISSKVDLKMDPKRISGDQSNKINFFNAYLCIDDEEIQAFPVTISFLELSERVLGGYRPNRHDKNSVVILEEVIEDITAIAGQSSSLNFHKADNSTHWSLSLEYDEFVVEDLH